MKRSAFILALALGFLSSALHADEMAVAGTADVVSAPPAQLAPTTPPLIKRLTDGLHVFDNATPFSGYDISSGLWQAGLKTEFYRKWYTCLDLGGIAPLHSDATLNFMTGARLVAGELAYDKIPWFHSAVDAWGLRNGLLQYAQGGIYVSRDWTARHTSWGPYAGVEIPLPWFAPK